MTPANWREARFRYLASVQKGRLPSLDSAADPNEKSVPYLTMDYLRGENSNPILVPADTDGLFTSNKSFILLWDGSNAGEFLTAKPGVVASTSALIEPKDIDARFFFWACKAQERQLKAENIGMGVPHVNGEFLADLRLRLPSPRQQSVIASYLDRATASLDALITAKERSLNLLTEKRLTIVAHAVTRGLDRRAVLRESQIPWLGETPSHWDIWKLGHVATIGNGSTPSRSNAAYWTCGTIPWLSSSIVGQHEVKEATQFVTQAALHECQLPLVKKGSVLVGIVGQGKTRGAATVLSIDATINQNLAYVSPVSTLVDPWYLRWSLFAAYEHLRSISDDGGRAKGTLTCENLANLKVAIPPLGEQRQIVAHIAKEISKLDRLLALIEMTTELLKERREALISEAVSGQLDVDRAA